MVKQILIMSLWILTAAGIAVLLWFSWENYKQLPVTELKLNILKAEERGFLNHDEIEYNIDNYCDTLIGKKIYLIDTKGIEKMLKKSPWIESATAVVSLNGVLRVNLKERRPIVRVFGEQGQTAYIDQNETIFPVNSNYTPHVMVVSGYLDFKPLDDNSFYQLSDSLYSKTQLKNVYIIVNELNKDRFLNALVDQVYLNSKGDFEFLPKLSGSTVVVGDVENLEEKFKKMKAFYLQKAGSSELANYQTISLKYKNQIVCTKK